VLPEQLAVWSYPKAGESLDSTAFNMVNAMLTRIHQSGTLATLDPENARLVKESIRLYKDQLRSYIPRMVPFFPLGTANINDTQSPVAVGLKGADRSFIAVWRLAGEEIVRIPLPSHGKARILYPTELGVGLTAEPGAISLNFPRPYMAVLVEVRPRL
jgi:alpha-galactosidase